MTLTNKDEENLRELLVSIECCDNPIEIEYSLEEIAKYLKNDK
jgi:hypothetical protein